MKAILVVDVPDDVEIEDCEIEYSVKEQVMLTQVAKGKTKLKPMPMKRISTVDWLHTETQTQSATSIGKYPSDYTQIKTYEPSDYDKGWNDCVDFMEGGEQ